MACNMYNIVNKSNLFHYQCIKKSKNKKNFFIETVGFYIQKLFQLFCFTVFELLISERHSSSHSPEHLHYYKEI